MGTATPLHVLNYSLLHSRPTCSYSKSKLRELTAFARAATASRRELSTFALASVAIGLMKVLTHAAMDVSDWNDEKAMAVHQHRIYFCVLLHLRHIHSVQVTSYPIKIKSTS